MHETKYQRIQKGRIIRKLRHAAHLSVKGLTTLCQISRTTLYSIENGHYTINSPSVYRICTAFGIEYEELLDIEITGELIKNIVTSIKRYISAQKLPPQDKKLIMDDRKAFNKPTALVALLIENKLLLKPKTVEEIHAAIHKQHGVNCKLKSLIAALQDNPKIIITKAPTHYHKNLYKQR